MSEDESLAPLPVSQPSVTSLAHLAQMGGSSSAPTQFPRPAGNKRDREDDDEATGPGSPPDASGRKERPNLQPLPGRQVASHRSKRTRQQIWIRAQDLALPAVWDTLRIESEDDLLKRADAPGVDRAHFCPQLLGLQGALDSPVPSFIDDWADPSITPTIDTLSCYVHRLGLGQHVSRNRRGTQKRIGRLVRTCLGPDQVSSQLNEDADWLDKDLDTSEGMLFGWADRYPIDGQVGAKVAWTLIHYEDGYHATILDSLARASIWEISEEEIRWYQMMLDNVTRRARIGNCQVVEVEQCLVRATAFDPLASLPITALVLHVLAHEILYYGGYEGFCYCINCPRDTDVEPQSLQSEWMMRLRTAQVDFLKAGIGKETLRAIMNSRSVDS